MTGHPSPLPPTSPHLLEDSGTPYFVWWADVAVGELRALLADPDPAVSAYWLGALLREANTRDVWLFVSPARIRGQWPRLLPHLGRTRAMWAYLLGMDDPGWPPSEARA